MKKNIPNEGLPGWDWPAFKSDRERIKYYSQKCKNEQLSVAEMFNSVYNLNLTGELLTSPYVNDVPYELSVGDLITTKILSVSKNKVVFDAGNLKANLQSNINLYKYDRFKHFIPTDPINAIVTDVKKDRVTIDPIVPMIESWMNPILKDPSIQKIVPNKESGLVAKPVIVKDLQLTKGGFKGKAVIPNVSDFVGEDYVMEAFIPGSQIVLNITDNFEQFVGRSVETFIMNYMNKPGTNNKSLICSVKEVIKFQGELNMIKLFNSWCEDSEYWKETSNITFEGLVTGVINSSKKCGVFIEIPELSITGMVATKPEDLVNYKPHMPVPVKIAGFDEETYFDYTMQQVQHVVPYEIENGALKKCNLKPILQFA